MNVPWKSKSLLLLDMIREGSKSEFYVAKYCDKARKGNWKYESRNYLPITDITLEVHVCFYLSVKICICRCSC